MSHFTCLSSTDYYQQLLSNINTAQTNQPITIASLWIKPEEPIVAEIMDALCAAARRGVAVLLIVDAFTFLIKEGATLGPAFWQGPRPKRLKPPFRLRQQTLDDLKRAGGNYAVINWPKRALANPFRMRSHVKFSIVGDAVYVGGCNLAETDQSDVMVRFDNHPVATQLRELAVAFAATGTVHAALEGMDQEIIVDEHTKILIDAGLPRQSHIMDVVRGAARRAHRTAFVTLQYFPHASLADVLEGAHERGARTTVLYNHPSAHAWPLNIIYRYLGWEARRGRSPIFIVDRLKRSQRYLHAKVFRADDETVVGSHNFMPNGVRVGTAEIALYSTNPALANTLQAVVKRQLR